MKREEKLKVTYKGPPPPTPLLQLKKETIAKDAVHHFASYTQVCM